MKQSTLIKLEKATFKSLINNSKAKSIFKNPISLKINANEKWAILGSHKEQIMRILSAKYVTDQPFSRTYPFLKKEVWPSSVIELLDFKGVLPTAHLSARYEFFKDEYDNTTLQFIKGYDYNSNKTVDEVLVEEVIKRLNLNGLENRWVMGLSNGQMRRARIAKALIKQPKLLLFDDPFLGLDPKAHELVDGILENLPPNPYVILGLNSKIPKWITHICIANENGIVVSGDRSQFSDEMISEMITKCDSFPHEKFSVNRQLYLFQGGNHINKNESHIQFDDISISYRGAPVLTNLHWTVKKGEKWHIRGDNGTGKSTLLSLITADHPQSWSKKVVLKGEPRKTGKQSYFDINESIGFSSPELHSIFPGHLSVFNAIATGFRVSNFLPPFLNEDEVRKVNDLIREFQIEDVRDRPFRELSVSDQKLVLFLRAIVKQPELLILDEALSVMVTHRIEQCKSVINNWHGTVLCIAHNANEVPNCDKYIRLLGPGKTDIGVPS